jgi:hypothetical protein
MASLTTKKNQNGQPYNKEEPKWPALQRDNYYINEKILHC